MEHTTSLVNRKLFRGVQSADDGHAQGLAILSGHDHGQWCPRVWRALNRKGFGAVDGVGLSMGASYEFEWQYAHANEIGAMNTFKAFGDNDFNSRKANALSRPIP